MNYVDNLPMGIQIVTDLDITALRCRECSRMWRAPAMLTDENRTYLVDHVFGHTPAARARAAGIHLVDQKE